MAKTAVMLHGAGGGGWEWAIWQRVFAARGFAALAPDFAPRPALADTQFADYVAQTVSALAREDTSPASRAPDRGTDSPILIGAPHRSTDAPILIGASLGGLVALVAAAKVRPRALVLVNPLPPAPLHTRLPAREPYDPVVPWRRDASLGGTRRALFDATDADALLAFRAWRDESGAVLNAARAGIATEPQHCRVMIVASGLDDDVPPAVSRALADRLGATFVLVPDAGHVGPLLGRSAARTATQVLDWLA